MAGDAADADLLRQWEEKIAAVGDPFGALADVLAQGAAQRTTLFQQVGERVLGCDLRTILGAGGMGVTYGGVAADGAPVAVKLVVGVGESATARFAQECRLLRAFDHPAIVRYRDHAVLDDGTGVLVMDRIDGVDLEHLLQDVLRDAPPATVTGAELLHEVGGGLRERLQSPRYRRRILRLLATVAEGLAAAHACGVVHRDVKPANVLVRDDLSPVVIDFGLARDQQLGVSLTASGAAMGTLAYMAPEQLGRDPGAVGPRTDVYALGLVLYRALLGRDLRADVADVVQAASRPFVLGARAARALPGDLQAILYACLDPRPRQRYASMQALADDLRAAAAGEPVSARRPGWLQRLGRDRSLLRTVALAVVAVAAVAAVWAWPRGREVVFAANVLAADATLALGDGRTIALGDPAWLPFGPVAVTLRGAAIAPVERTIEVVAGVGRQWVSLRSRYDGQGAAELRLPGRAPVQFTSGHSYQPLAPGAPLDERWVDGVAVPHWEPYHPVATVPPGWHEFRARDGRGREETQRLAIGAEPEDVQVLPAVLAAVDGRYRRTWSTVWSPLPDDLTWSGTAERWTGPARATEVASAGTMTNDCAFAPAAAATPATVVLRCRFPEAMRSAVVSLRGGAQPGGRVEVLAGFAGEPLRPWPLLPNGRLAPLQQFASAVGSDAFVVQATLTASAPSTPVVALARVCEGALFGGHWRTEPPCFALAADPSPGVAVLRPATAVALASVPMRAAQPWPFAPAGDAVGVVVGIDGPAGGRRHAPASRAADAAPAAIHVVDDGGGRADTIAAAWLHAREDARDGAGFGEVLLPWDDLDGDGWQELVIGDRTSRHRGPGDGGAVALRRSRDGARAWIWPTDPSTAAFGDDHAGDCAAGGDWNGDGRADLAVGAQHAAAAQGVEKVGRLAVLDVRTGAPLWSMHGDRPLHSPRLVASHPRPDGGPAALLLVATPRVPGMDRPLACQGGLWLGGVGGRLLWTPAMQPSAQFGVVGAPGGDERPAVVVLRRGPWHDEFVGAERYEPAGDRLQLAAQCRLAGLSEARFEHGSGPEAVALPDLDGDGCADVAFVLAGAEPQLLLLSGRTVRPLARVSLAGSGTAGAAGADGAYLVAANVLRGRGDAADRLVVALLGRRGPDAASPRHLFLDLPRR
ncbi:MAG: protein kinase domain-containing protein [Planctomycetota bacterium]